MQPSGHERRREHPPDEEFRGIAARSLREGVPVDELNLRLNNPDGSDGPDAKRVDELRAGAKKALLAMAGYAPEAAAAELRSAESTGSEPAPPAPEKVLTSDQRASLLSMLEARFTSDTERYHDIEWPKVKAALESADKKTLYALFKLEENGHEVGVVKAEKGGRNGFRFDSCSKESPAGVRNVDYFKAAETVQDWRSNNDTVDLDLMERDLFEELRKSGIITNAGTWDYLKTENPGTPKEPDLAWFGHISGIGKSNARHHHHDGGFRCSLWVL